MDFGGCRAGKGLRSHCWLALPKTCSHTLGHRSLSYHGLSLGFMPSVPFLPQSSALTRKGGCGSCCLMLLLSESKFHAVSKLGSLGHRPAL